MKEGADTSQLRFKRFPPGLGTVHVPLISRPAAAAGLVLYAPCKPHTMWMHRIALRVVHHLGARALPGRSVAWSPPMAAGPWQALCAQWRRELGPFGSLAVVERPQRFRAGLALLLLDEGRPRAFVKLRRHGGPVLQHEYGAMRQVWRFRPRSFSIPEPIGTGRVDDWDYLATAALASPAHRVARDPPLAAIHGEIEAALQALPRGPAVPGDWRPMHGDFTPWNLRELPDSTLVLFDWEDAAWGPPGADDVLYRASRAALDASDPGPHPAVEAARYWHSRVGARSTESQRERRLAASLCDAFARMQNGRGRER